MMHIDPICACIHAYTLTILNKISVALNNYILCLSVMYKIKITNKVTIVVNSYTFTTINHAMKGASNETIM